MNSKLQNSILLNPHQNLLHSTISGTDVSSLKEIQGKRVICGVKVITDNVSS